jgi:hypothetical protein
MVIASTARMALRIHVQDSTSKGADIARLHMSLHMPHDCGFMRRLGMDTVTSGTATIILPRLDFYGRNVIIISDEACVWQQPTCHSAAAAAADRFLPQPPLEPRTWWCVAASRPPLDLGPCCASCFNRFAASLPLM